MPRLLCMILALLALAAPARAIDDEHRQKADAMIARAIAYLLAQQHESGGWSVREGAPVFPAVTGLVVNGLAMQPGFDAQAPAVRRAVAFLISHQQPDGGIYDRILPSYNTAICISALARLGTPEASAAVEKALPFLKGLQFSEGALATGPTARETQRVDRDHPFYGGVGYGNHGRPDLSNTAFFIQAMRDAGVPSDDPAFQRALVFLSRVQMHGDLNDMPYADGSRQGGFIYATSPNKDNVGGGQSFAGEIEESLDDGTRVSRLRAYGSMTYAGFKSLIYAKLRGDDPRVRAAQEWISRNYTLAENPGLGTDGMYYYYLAFARALDAFGQEQVPIAEGQETVMRDWANDLIDALAKLQNENGSFRSVDDRWMENDPVLITAYAVIALQHAAR
jgi:squalene-hopene/tetraprenyl-beta-curcumene cyclase